MGSETVFASEGKPRKHKEKQRFRRVWKRAARVGGGGVWEMRGGVGMRRGGREGGTRVGGGGEMKGGVGVRAGRPRCRVGRGASGEMRRGVGMRRGGKAGREWASV